MQNANAYHDNTQKIGKLESEDLHALCKNRVSFGTSPKICFSRFLICLHPKLLKDQMNP